MYTHSNFSRGCRCGPISNYWGGYWPLALLEYSLHFSTKYTRKPTKKKKERASPAVVRIFVEHWGDNLQFYPNFALFSTLGGLNLDQDFFQVNKSSEDQKKGLPQKWNTLYPRIQVQTCAQMHTKVKLLEGMQMKTILKLLGGYSQIIGGDISPHPPRVSAPLFAKQSLQFPISYQIKMKSKKRSSWDICCIFLANKGEDQKKVVPSKRRVTGTVPYGKFDSEESFFGNIYALKLEFKRSIRGLILVPLNL